MITVGIVGGTGYTGGELLRLAFVHPALEVTQVTSRKEVGAPLSTLWPQLEGRSALRFTAPEVETLRQCDLVFFATPNGTAMTMVPALLDAAVKVVDLSADFRLRDLDAWERWYGMPHACPELVDNAVYGLPECHRDAVREASLIANPGCYPTAVLLALVPLLERELIDPQHLIADAKSGVSGAGRKASLSVLHGEVAENFRAYGVGGHRHHRRSPSNSTSAARDQPDSPSRPIWYRCFAACKQLFMPTLRPIVKRCERRSKTVTRRIRSCIYCRRA